MRTRQQRMLERFRQARAFARGLPPAHAAALASGLCSLDQHVGLEEVYDGEWRT